MDCKGLTSDAFGLAGHIADRYERELAKTAISIANDDQREWATKADVITAATVIAESKPTYIPS